MTSVCKISLKICLFRRPKIYYFPRRIVRNKAAERAKVSYNSGGGGGPSCSPGGGNAASSGGGGGAADSHSPPGAAGLMAGDSLLQRPSYSINGILGIPQPDANANNINKRKRDDDEGEGRF